MPNPTTPTDLSSYSTTAYVDGKFPTSSISGVLVARVAISLTTVYTATSDGVVEAFYNGNADAANIKILSDTSADPTTYVGGISAYYPGGSDKVYPASAHIIKGWKFKVTGDATTINWIALGS